MNKLVVCPYDEAHKVKESRLSLHITKCRLNHLDEEKFICPFNATHVLPRQERDYHLLHCGDRAPLDRKMASNSIDRDNPFKGNLSVPSYTQSTPAVSDEIWDDEEYYDSTPRGHTIPTERPAFAIIDPPALAKPAERRKLYQELHRMPTEAESIHNQVSHTTTRETVAQLNRQPKAPSQVENKKNQEFQSLGLGRGRPVAANRIAANIFTPPVNTSNSGNYSAALTSRMSNLGLGRGLSTGQGNDNTLDEDDFPALGCGRGVFRSAKSGGARYPGARN